MKTTEYLFLEQIFGVSVAKVKVTVGYADDWVHQLVTEPFPARGRKTVKLEFETSTKLKEYEYGSIKVISYSTSLYDFINTYECLCLSGKETKGLLESLL